MNIWINIEFFQRLHRYCTDRAANEVYSRNAVRRLRERGHAWIDTNNWESSTIVEDLEREVLRGLSDDVIWCEFGDDTPDYTGAIRDWIAMIIKENCRKRR